MAKREVVDCDICGRKDCEDYSEVFKFFNKRVPDGAGGMQDEYDIYYVCMKCQTHCLKRIQQYLEGKSFTNRPVAVPPNIFKTILEQLKEEFNGK